MWLRLVQGHQLVPGSSFDPCFGVIFMLLISLSLRQTITFFVQQACVFGIHKEWHGVWRRLL